MQTLKHRYRRVLDALGIDNEEDDPVGIINVLKKANIRLIKENKVLTDNIGVLTKGTRQGNKPFTSQVLNKEHK